MTRSGYSVVETSSSNLTESARISLGNGPMRNFNNNSTKQNSSACYLVPTTNVRIYQGSGNYQIKRGGVKIMTSLHPASLADLHPSKPIQSN